jgi:hypothetical protein
MADQPIEPPHEEGNSTPTPGRQPGFLDRLDSALGLELAGKPTNTLNTDQGGLAGQVVASPISTEMDPKARSGNLRPGFFGAKGPMYEIYDTLLNWL